MPLRSAAFALALALPALATAAAHAEPPAPGGAPVTVAVQRDAASVHEGDTVVYRVDIINHTATDYPAAVVTQLLPGGMRAVSVDEGGTANGTAVEWTAHLEPGATLHRALTATVGKREQIESGRIVQVAQPNHDAVKDGSQFSTTACFRPDATARPLACGSDFAALPVEHDAGLWGSRPVLGGAALAAVATALGVLLFRRRRAIRRTRHSA
ncbi:hypothetical protein CFP65_0950 [Kitasatospora sp. MMS16-BH015]|nr:hypothetical protein CFP65_0950 [Kitasatospora sp. MMS16-BH015]